MSHERSLTTELLLSMRIQTIKLEELIMIQYIYKYKKKTEKTETYACREIVKYMILLITNTRYPCYYEHILILFTRVTYVGTTRFLRV